LTAQQQDQPDDQQDAGNDQRRGQLFGGLVSVRPRLNPPAESKKRQRLDTNICQLHFPFRRFGVFNGKSLSAIHFLPMLYPKRSLAAPTYSATGSGGGPL
jgi:hypothetical protein